MKTEFSNSVAGKFYIYESGQAPDGFRVTNLDAGWKIALDDTIQIFEVRNDGRLIGWLLGDPVDLDREEMVNTHIDLDAAEDRESDWEAIKARCAGSWLYIAISDGGLTLYPDASATIGAVYETATKRIAAYAYLLIQDDYFSRLDETGREANQVEKDGWFTGGLTAHSGIFRLLPNHCLSTTDFVARRAPLTLPNYSDAPVATLNGLLSELRVVVRAVRQSRQTHIALTGGNETRVILAALRQEASELSFVNLQFAGEPLDLFLSTTLADFAQLSLRHLHAIETDEAMKQEWMTYAGHAMSGANKDYYPSIGSLEGSVLIGGIGGEVGRGFLWPDGLKGTEELTAQTILSRLKLPATKANSGAVNAWLKELPGGLDAFQILDLAYLELRLGPWGFAQPRMRIVPRSIHPLLSYNQFLRMWSLPPDLRTSNRMMVRLIELSWSELLQIPINRYGNWRDQWYPISRALRRPDKAFRKIKQLLGW